MKDRRKDTPKSMEIDIFPSSAPTTLMPLSDRICTGAMSGGDIDIDIVPPPTPCPAWNEEEGLAIESPTRLLCENEPLGGGEPGGGVPN